MELPGAEDKTYDEILELIDECREENKLLKIKVDAPKHNDSEFQDVYATKLYDLPEKDGEMFMTYATGKIFNKEGFWSEQALHDTMKHQYEAEVIDVSDIEDDDVKSRLKKWMLKENPLQEVHIFVKHRDDGRYKDEWAYRRGPDEETIRENEGLPTPDSGEDKVFFHLGSYQEVLENAEKLGKEHDFDFRKDWSGSMPVDFRALTDTDKREELRQTIGGESSQ
ncbi:hypothetical protein KY092_08000 [Natronomonas gomsonensis]|uniref:hypothetical protein n=1 Tax=Natronomonas gomsonensis TaxID=1046043 RepID=UPI0020CA8A66|nr:hypothetical protein [Natronomonas gomsonensis]MCY4730499.1 hypothetical protein [Natronomonas gomsonensis]